MTILTEESHRRMRTAASLAIRHRMIFLRADFFGEIPQLFAKFAEKKRNKQKEVPSLILAIHTARIYG